MSKKIRSAEISKKCMSNKIKQKNRFKKEIMDLFRKRKKPRKNEEKEKNDNDNDTDNYVYYY